MGNLTLAQKIHTLVGILAALIWVGLLVLGYESADPAKFAATFGDLITLAKETVIGALAGGAIVGNFHVSPVAQDAPEDTASPKQSAAS